MMIYTCYFIPPQIYHFWNPLARKKLPVDMRKYIPIILLVFATLICVEGHSKQPPSKSVAATITSNDLKILVGEWEGTLTYIDYSSNKPYTMPANLVIEHGRDEYQLKLSYIYPNEPKANSTDMITVSKKGTQLNKREVKLKQSLSDQRINIITEYLGKDNKRKAVIRNTYTLGEKQFTIRKEVQFENSDQWLKRNEYMFYRLK